MAVAQDTRNRVHEKAAENLAKGKKESELKEERKKAEEAALTPPPGTEKKGKVWTFDECAKSVQANIEELSTTLAKPIGNHVESLSTLIESHLQTLGAPAYALLSLARMIRIETDELLTSGKVTDAQTLAKNARMRWKEAIPGLEYSSYFKATRKTPPRTEVRPPETLTEAIKAILQRGPVEPEDTVVKNYDTALRQAAQIFMEMNPGLKLPQAPGGRGRGGSATDPSPKLVVQGVGDPFKLMAAGGPKHFEAFVKSMGGWDAAMQFCENFLEWAEEHRPEENKEEGRKLQRVSA